MKTLEQIELDINDYIFGCGGLQDYTEEMEEIVFDTKLEIEEMTKELEEKNGGKNIDVNDPLYDEWERRSDEIVAKAAEKIFNMQK